MQLSNNDITLILDKVNPKFAFYEEIEGDLYLLNKFGHCIFFDVSKKKCNIYKVRPKGCRFYPYVYDNGICVVDSECSNRENFPLIDYETSNQIKIFIKLLEEECKHRTSGKKDK